MRWVLSKIRWEKKGAEGGDVRVSAVPAAPSPQSAAVAPSPGVSRVHGAKLQITGRNCSQNLQSSRVSSPRPSLGPSPSLWPIWRWLSSEALPGAALQDRAWQEAAREEDDGLRVHLLWMQTGGGEGFPSLDILHQKTESLFLAWQCSTPSTSSACPGQDAAPGIPQNQQNSANLLQTPAAQQCRSPGTSQRCLCLPCGSLCPSPRASLLFLPRVLFHCCLPSSQGSKF